MHFMYKMVIEKNKYHVGLERDRQIQVAVAARCQYASLRTMSSQIDEDKVSMGKNLFQTKCV